MWPDDWSYKGAKFIETQRKAVWEQEPAKGGLTLQEEKTILCRQVGELQERLIQLEQHMDTAQRQLSLRAQIIWMLDADVRFWKQQADAGAMAALASTAKGHSSH